MSEESKIEQLEMGLQEPFSNRFKNFKYKVEIFFVKMRTNSLLTSPFLWINFVATISLLLVQSYYYTNFFDKLPKEIPLFTIAKTSELRLVEKDFLLLILIFSIFLTIVSVFLTLKTFYRSKFVSIFIMTNLLLTVLFITLSYIKIFGIYIF